jgi:hypothetical protein
LITIYCNNYGLLIINKIYTIIVYITKFNKILIILAKKEEKRKGGKTIHRRAAGVKRRRKIKKSFTILARADD